MVTVSLLATACGGQGVIDQVLATSTTTTVAPPATTVPPTTTVAVASDTALFLADFSDSQVMIMKTAEELSDDPDPLASLADVWGDAAAVVSSLEPTPAVADLRHDWLLIASDFEDVLNAYGPSIGDPNPEISQSAGERLRVRFARLQARSLDLDESMTALIRDELELRTDDSAIYVVELLDAIDGLTPYLNQAIVGIQLMSSDLAWTASRLQAAADGLVSRSEAMSQLDPPARLRQGHRRQVEFFGSLGALMTDIAEARAAGRDSKDLVVRIQEVFGKSTATSMGRVQMVADVLRDPAAG